MIDEMLRRAGWASMSIVLAGCSLFILDEGEFSGGRGSELDSGPHAGEGGGTLDGQADQASAEGGARDAAPSSNRYVNAVLADGPALYLRFGETSGTTAKAVVGGNGTYSAAGITLGAPGAIAGDTDRAATLTDGFGRITVASGFAFEGTSAFSIEIWANPSAMNTGYGFIADHTDWTADRRGWSFLVGTEGIRLERWANNIERGGVGAAAISAGTWHHVVASFDGGVLRIYVDGVRAAATPNTVALTARTSTLTIGGDSCCGAEDAFIGSIDELAIYDKALNDTQVAAHYAAAK